ncbi:MAG: GNAT family N-acetyltransferase [Planctomycetes bacterium]|nr:GNAT family N-acetyltransferase [Planctomycetota bacterium]
MEGNGTQALELESVHVRRLRPDDLERVIAIDARITGRRREEYFKVKLRQALSGAGVEVSLAGEVDGSLVGYLIARVWYGEFGRTEPVAVLDTVGVHPDFRTRGVGHALVSQLRTNLLGLNVKTLCTEVVWGDMSTLAFFQREGFRPAERISLDLDLEEARRRETTA